MLLQAGMAQHADLLQKGWPLAPEAALGYDIAAETECQRCLDGRLPTRHVVVAQQTAVRLAGGIAHQLNNLLTVVIGNLAAMTGMPAMLSPFL